MCLRLLSASLLSLVVGASPAAACSIGKMSPRELRAEQVRDLREADSVFLARVTALATTDEAEYNLTYFEPIQTVRGSGDLPESLAVPVFYCIPQPAVGDIRVILMSPAPNADPAAPSWNILGDYAPDDIGVERLSQQVEWAMQRTGLD